MKMQSTLSAYMGSKVLEGMQVVAVDNEIPVQVRIADGPASIHLVHSRPMPFVHVSYVYMTSVPVVPVKSSVSTRFKPS